MVPSDRLESAQRRLPPADTEERDMTDLSSRERAVLAEEAAWRADRDIELERRAAARPRPVLADVGPGWSVWSTTRTDSHDGQLGGVVLYRSLGRFAADDETGEVVTVPQFRVIDPFPSRHPAFHTLDASDIDPDTIEQPESWRLHLLITRLARELVAHGTTKRSVLAHADERLCLVASMHHLAGATRPEHRTTSREASTEGDHK